MSKTLIARRAKVEAELAAIKKEEEEIARHKDLLIAKIVKERMATDTAFEQQIHQVLDAGLKKQRDRQLFDLPRRTKPKTVEADEKKPTRGMGFFQQTSAN